MSDNPATAEKPVNKLRSVGEFRRLLRSFLQDQHVIFRPTATFLREAYRLATRAHRFQKQRDAAFVRAKTDRLSLRRTQRVGRHLANAIAAIEKAKRAADDLVELELLQVNEAQHLLQEARKDFLFLEQGDIASIHRKLRTRHEERELEKGESLTNVPLEFTPAGVLSGLGFAKIDYWLIEQIERLLEECSSKSGGKLRPVDYDRIIKATFLAALGKTVGIDMVKTARRRIVNKRTITP